MGFGCLFFVVVEVSASGGCRVYEPVLADGVLLWIIAVELAGTRLDGEA